MLYKSTLGVACSNALRRTLYYNFGVGDVKQKEAKVQLSRIKFSSFILLTADQRFSLLLNLTIPGRNAPGSTVFKAIVAHLLPFIRMTKLAKESQSCLDLRISASLRIIASAVGIEKSLSYLVNQWACSKPESRLKLAFTGMCFFW